ncbi:hypothetical protein [Phaeodactylibacter xiamenensis]|uniref:hypothetical protein n=1 Tax=Phaeodactylibacter xiamenensis TaxID=1524460 RepID=UPI0024A7E777|nr:hypothetical protein [Phaeodactylibacter xiamenensis]
MKKIKLILYTVLLIISWNKGSAQLNIANLSGAYLNIREDKANLNENLFGPSLQIEAPFQSINFAFRVSYFTPANQHSRFDYIYSWRIGGGKVLNNGHRFQFPIYLGIGKYNSKGDFSFGNYSYNAETGLRFFLTNRLALHSTIGYNFLLAPNFTYTDQSGDQVSRDLTAKCTVFSIGISFSYRKI